MLIDGHDRYRICEAHGVPYQVVQKDFADRNSVLLWIINNQVSRRKLPTHEMVRLALRKEPIYAELAKANQGTHTDLFLKSEKSKFVTPIDSYKEIAKAAGVGHDTVAKVRKIEAVASPEVKKQLRNQKISINQAYQQIRQDEKKQEVQQRIADYISVQTGTVDIATTDKKYSIIYADPAWQYWEGGQKNQSLQYTTITIEDICALPVKRIADDNCVLFLWVTYPILQEAFKVIEGWGSSIRQRRLFGLKRMSSRIPLLLVVVLGRARTVNYGCLLRREILCVLTLQSRR